MSNCKGKEGEHKHQCGYEDKPASLRAVAHMTTVRIYLCVQDGEPLIHRKSEFIIILKNVAIYKKTSAKGTGIT